MADTNVPEGIAKDSKYDEFEIPNYVLFPEYAIGMGLITRDDYNALSDQYYTQARILTGVFLPLIGLVLVLAFSGLPPVSWWIYAILLTCATAGVFFGMDRLHKFYSALQTLIISKYVAKKQAEQAEKDKPQPAPPSYVTAKDIEDLKSFIHDQLRNPVTIYNVAQSPRREG